MNQRRRIGGQTVQELYRRQAAHDRAREEAHTPYSPEKDEHVWRGKCPRCNAGVIIMSNIDARNPMATPPPVGAIAVCDGCGQPMRIDVVFSDRVQLSPADLENVGGLFGKEA